MLFRSRLGACCILLVALTVPLTAPAGPGEPGWLREARIATPWDVDLPGFTWEAGVDRAVADGATVILDWVGASDSWRFLFEPDRSRDLVELERRAAHVHSHPGVRYVVYYAPLEWVSWDVDNDGDGRVDPGREADSLTLQHPDWAQTGIDGRRAVFYGSMPGMPFWVCPSCEDVWVTPAHPGYRALVMEQVRLMAATSLDGFWLDVPFLRTDFGPDWTDQWTDVGPAARARFSAETGHTLPPPPLSPDWADPDWRAFVRWRYRLIREFLDEIRRTALAADPEFALVVESSVGFGPEQTQTAASPVDIPGVSHATVHEAGETNHAVQRSTWLHYLAKLAAWRHLDARHGQPSWLLTYAEADRPETAGLVRLQAAATLLSGFTSHVSGNEGMAGSPDPAFRARLFSWMAAHRPMVLPAGARPHARTALLFSRETLDFRVRGSWERGDAADGFLGMGMLLLEGHVPYEVISEEHLDDLSRFTTLILPGVEALGDAAAHRIREWVRGGGRLLATGLTSAWDGEGLPRGDFALADLFGVHRDQVEEGDTRVWLNAVGAGRCLYTPAPRERWYYWAGAPWDESGGDEAAMAVEREALLALLERLAPDAFLQTDAPPGVLLLPFLARSGALHLNVIHLEGTGHGDPSPDPVEFTVTLSLPAHLHASASTWLPFLGSPISLPPAAATPGSLTFRITTESGGTLLLADPGPVRRPSTRPSPGSPPPGAAPTGALPFSESIPGPGAPPPPRRRTPPAP